MRWFANDNPLRSDRNILEIQHFTVPSPDSHREVLLVAVALADIKKSAVKPTDFPLH